MSDEVTTDMQDDHDDDDNREKPTALNEVEEEAPEQDKADELQVVDEKTLADLFGMGNKDNSVKHPTLKMEVLLGDNGKCTMSCPDNPTKEQAEVFARLIYKLCRGFMSQSIVAAMHRAAGEGGNAVWWNMVIEQWEDYLMTEEVVDSAISPRVVFQRYNSV